MREFHAEDWFEIRERGWCAAFGAHQMPDDLYDPGQMRGEEVLIDGERYTVRAAETFAILRSSERPYRKSFSLLVDGKPPTAG